RLPAIARAAAIQHAYRAAPTQTLMDDRLARSNSSPGWLRGLARWAAVVVVTLLALALHLRAVEKIPIDFDEDDYMLAAQHYAAALAAGDWREIVNWDYNSEHPPLTKLLYGAA